LYRLGCAALLASLFCCAAARAADADIVPGGRYGNVHVALPSGPMRGFVVLFSTGHGWSGADQAAADALAGAGALTVGVDTARYAANLAADKEACHQLVGDAEALSHQFERQRESSRYFAPIVAGTGEGATLALEVLAQAPANTVAGAVSIDPQAVLDPRFELCPPDPTISRGKGLPGFVAAGVTSAKWTGATQQAERAAAREDVASDRPDHAKAEPLPGAPRVFASGTTRAAQLIELIGPHLQTVAHDAELDVSDLPLVELPAAKQNGTLAVVMSGDGGWRDMDKTIAEALQKDGVSVVGWDSLRYFWSEKTPAQVSGDLARVLQTYMRRWHATHIALIGYSFGADVMPFAFNRLPASLRERISLVSLLGFAPKADFQVRVTGWLGMPPSDSALPVRPELARMPARIVECFYGEHEADTLCPALSGTGIELIRTPGEHHFGGHYQVLEQHILQAWEKRLGAQDALAGTPG
jgi:type IV secretory pathway VirJ component